MRYFIRFAYRGTNYHGSQRQPNGITVQEVLEDAMTRILRTPVTLTFAGRTDAGVHALEMFAHFDWNGSLEALRSPIDTIYHLNALLPYDIVIYDLYPVKEDAHARFDAIARRYEYRVTWQKNPFTEGLCARVPQDLDFELMNAAAQHLIGRQDFASFSKVHTDVKTTVCTVTQASWNYDLDRQEATFTIQADRFLRNMVRAIVGTLLLVGRHKITPADFQKIIACQDRCSAGDSAAPEGLYLVHVQY